MKIAMIGQKGLPAIYGGVEQHVYELSTGLVSHGYDVTAYARRWYTKGAAHTVDGVRIVHTPTITTKHLDAIVHTFISTLHAIVSGFDVIHYHGVGPSLLSFIPRILSPKTRVVVTFHSIDRYHQKWNWFAKTILKLGEWTACHFPHETITISRGIRLYCQNEYLKETTYIPYGITKPTHPKTSSTLATHGLLPDSYLVMISRLVPHKGAHVLLEAFTNLKKKYATDPLVRSLKLAIVGGAVYTDAYVAQLHRLAARSNDIVFTGFQSGKALEELYRNATALVHPSFNEGLPMTVLGAMAHGTPVLLSSIPEHAELTRDSRCLFHENNVDALEAALYTFIHLPAEERENIIAENFRTLTAEYEWNALIPKISAVYHREKPRKKTRVERLEYELS